MTSFGIRITFCFPYCMSHGGHWPLPEEFRPLTTPGQSLRQKGQPQRQDAMADFPLFLCGALPLFFLCQKAERETAGIKAGRPIKAVSTGGQSQTPQFYCVGS